ncbi:MAG: FecR domain-containing protein [Blastochloris sp.]|nr:FecR domain-containing protein [Blastochloris sp.]
MKIHQRLILLLCVLTGLLLLDGAQAQTVQGQAKGITGTVLLALPGETTFKPLTPNTAIPVGSRIRTGANGVATLLTVPEAAIRLQENTEITIKSLEYAKQGDQVTKRNALIELNNGTMSALIKKNDPKTTDFRIQTPQGVAAARGTFYAVTVKDGKSAVAVKEGKVSVKSDAAKKSVAQTN